ncbi:MAG: DNA topoisomerase (ATP-hydrolyzing) [Bacilli bacterium]
MASSRNEKVPVFNENISVEPLDTVMDEKYAIYAKYVIQDRAIPDVRDGLKPVQRRIIFSMYKNGNTFDKPTKKCAGIVGDVMGKYHPHGDTSIYEALVRMSQDWKMSAPLIKFQGNNGSIDNDSAAAYRYTEAKLNEFSMNLVKDIEKNTVDMALNFDDTLLEPVVLPCKFPNLYVNGSEGIAVAIATEIPPHNLIEMCNSTIYRINNPKCNVDDLLTIIKGPDFPTGGIIYKSEGIRDIYNTGRGRIEVASKVDVVYGKDENQLIISEIPFGVVKIDLVYSIDVIRKSREIDGIIDVIDETFGDVIKIVIDLKKEVDPNIVLTYLYNKTQLKISYNANIIAICNNSPKTLSLIDYLDEYINFQMDVVTRTHKFDLEKAYNRLEIIDGLIKVTTITDEVIKIIKSSKDKEDSKKNLIARYKFTENQAEAIVMMRLYKLSNADITAYLNEKKQLEEEIANHNLVLSDKKYVKREIINTLKDIIKNFGRERRTIIQEKQDEITIDKRSLIIKEDVNVVLTRHGYVKRCSLKSKKASNDSLPGVKPGDSIVMDSICNTYDYIVAITNKGNFLMIPANEIFDSKYKDEGKHINYLITLSPEENIINAFIIKDFNIDAEICIVSKNGQIKKSSLRDFNANRYTKPICCMKLLSGDEVVGADILYGNSNILVLTKAGTCAYFNENDITLTGLKTSGVKCISTLRNTEVKDVITFRNDEKSKVLLMTDKAMYRIFENSQIVLTQRLGKTQYAFKSFKSDVHELVFCEKLTEKVDELQIDCVLDNEVMFAYKLADFHDTSIDKYCKNNIEEISDPRKIKDCYKNYAITIDSSTKVEEKPKKSNNSGNNNDGNNNGENDTNDKDDDKERYEQISIFDDMGD